MRSMEVMRMDLNDFMAQQPKPAATASPEAVKDFNEGRIPEGQRNSTMSRTAASLLKRYGDSQEAYEKYLEQADLCDPPLPESELKTIWNSALKLLPKIESQEGYIEPEEFNDPTPRKPEDYSDVGQAAVFAEFCMGFVRYSPATDYLVYNGISWNETKTGAQAALHGFTQEQLEEAGKYVGITKGYMQKTGADKVIAEFGPKKAEKVFTPQQRKAYGANVKAQAYLGFVIKHRDSRYITAALKEARPMVEIEPEALDADGFLLNTPENTVDLSKGMDGIRPHDAEDLITKCTAVAPGDTGADIWEKALDTFFCGNRDLIAYVKQIAGLAAIGHVFVEMLIIAYGDGRNGKSTFWNVLHRILGTYSGSISADALTVGCRRNVKPELAESRGKRLLIAGELEEGMRLSTSIVKQICSTDPIGAEKKFKDPFTFTPSHTLVLYTNHLPKVGANDPGTWRKLVVVPFNAKIEGNADVKNYADVLFDSAGPAILKWIIEGAEEVIRNGFHIDVPDCVRRATDTYRENSDWFSAFLEECCEVGGKFTAPSGELYRRYREFCAMTGEYARSTSDFYAAVDLAGFERRRSKKGREVCGLRLKPEFLA